MKGLEKNKGITLVALVVTIIVLIILAGVSISLVLGQDGVVQKAKAGRDNYAEAARVENEQLANVDAFSIGIGDTIEPKADGMITNMTGGDLDISATVSLTSQGRTEIDFENTKYVFKTSSDPLGVTDSSLYSDGTITEANTTIKKAKSAGTYYLHVLLAEKNGNKQEIISEQTATSVGKKDFNYTGSAQDITLIPGNYKLEVWGAQGGTYSYTGGVGGYSKGTINLTQDTNMYILVGGQGSTTGGYNGGGNGVSSGRGGGGASDIRIAQNSLYSRVIVAGGGGGCGIASGNVTPAGCGGGIYGGDGYYNYTDGSASQRTGQARCGGGAGPDYAGVTWSTGSTASFGQGSNASGYSCGGGGGGWYGGAGAYDNDSDADGRYGGGGSGYVYTSSTVSNYPSGCLLNETYYLTDAQTIAGNTSFTSPTGSNETGHSGNGYARITAVD